MTLAPLFTWRSAVCESDLPPTARHVALTLSLYMNERGSSAFPGATRLARDTGLHESTVRAQLRDLCDAGWLEQTERGGQRGERRRANAYEARIPPTPLPLVQDDPSFRTTPRSRRADPSPTTRGTPRSGRGQLSMTTHQEHSTSAAGGDAMFEGLCSACSIDWTAGLPRRQRDAINAALADLRRNVGEVPRDEIAARADCYRERFPGATLTPLALVRHWAECAPAADDLAARLAEGDR